MAFLSFLFWRDKKSANVAKQRLQAVLAAERSVRAPHYLPALQRDLANVVSKYVKIQTRDVRISVERDRQQSEVLKVKVVLKAAPGLGRAS